MLTGEYRHNIDEKGRMNFPSRLREELGERFIITRWLDDCLVVFSEDEWQVMCDKIRQQPIGRSRDVQRYLFANAAVVEPDKQGRILIPQNLRTRAGLERDVVVIGVLNRAEIWNKDRWEAVNDSITSDMLDEKMRELDL